MWGQAGGDPLVEESLPVEASGPLDVVSVAVTSVVLELPESVPVEEVALVSVEPVDSVRTSVVDSLVVELTSVSGSSAAGQPVR